MLNNIEKESVAQIIASFRLKPILHERKETSTIHMHFEQYPVIYNLLPEDKCQKE